MTQKDEQLYVVRLYDGFDNCWMDVTAPMSKAEADAEWAQRTDNGTRAASFNDIDYYRVFPADTTMVHSEKGNRELGIDTVR